MPAFVVCPNKCRLRVPGRKLVHAFQCPKCGSSIFVSQDQIDRFQAGGLTKLQAFLTDDLVEVASDDIVHLGGEATEFPAEDSGSDSKSDVLPPLPSEEKIHPPPPPLKPGKKSEDSSPPVPDSEPRRAPGQASNDLSAGDDVLDKVLDKEEQKLANLDESIRAARSQHESIVDRTVSRLMSRFSDEDNRGVEHPTSVRWRAYSLAWAMVVIGLFLLAPVVYTMVGWIGQDYHQPLGRWSFLLMFFSAIQFLYALYLNQIPDWSTTRFVSYLMLGMTVLSTFLLSVAFLGSAGNSFFQFLQLSVAEKGKISGWLLIMVIGFGMLSYLCGRTTQTWMEDEARRAMV